jgi:thiol-disulfide isomerase/thioredoxin
VKAAQAAGKVVFVDAWAPWCHTCLSMQRDVLSKPALAAYADRVVFVAVDTDRPENAAFLSRFVVKLWPTFFAIGSDGERVLGVHPGSMDVQETTAFLDDAIRVAHAAAIDGPERALLEAHAALGRADTTTALAKYTEASATPWARRTEAIMGAMRVLSTTKDYGGCMRFGLSLLRAVDRGGAPGDLAGSVLACAEKLDDKKVLAETLPVLRARFEELVKSPPAGSAVDDKADVLATLADIEESLGNADAVKAAHVKRLALLEADAAAATTPKQAQVHDYARLNSLMALGRGAEAVALFEQRTKELPDDYEPAARLASTLFKLDRFAEADVAVEKAIALSYGTRRLRYRLLQADIAAKLKDVGKERAALEAIVAENAKLPAALADATLAGTAATRLAALPKP